MASPPSNSVSGRPGQKQKTGCDALVATRRLFRNWAGKSKKSREGRGVASARPESRDGPSPGGPGPEDTPTGWLGLLPVRPARQRRVGASPRVAFRLQFCVAPEGAAGLYARRPGFSGNRGPGGRLLHYRPSWSIGGGRNTKKRGQTLWPGQGQRHKLVFIGRLVENWTVFSTGCLPCFPWGPQTFVGEGVPAKTSMSPKNAARRVPVRPPNGLLFFTGKTSTPENKRWKGGECGWPDGSARPAWPLGPPFRRRHNATRVQRPAGQRSLPALGRPLLTTSGPRPRKRARLGGQGCLGVWPRVVPGHPSQAARAVRPPSSAGGHLRG